MLKHTLIFILAFGYTSYGQDVEFKSANFKDDKEGFKKAKENLDLGTDQYELGNAEVFQVRDP